jgi:chromosome segregation ATPase
MTSAQKSAQDAAKGVGKANQDLLKANIALEEAQKRFNEVVNGYGIGSKQASSKQDLLDKAQRDVERSGYGVEQALFAVTDAELKLQELRATEGATPQDIREAEIALAEAKLSVKDAIDQQKEATDAYAEANRQLDVAVNGAKEGSEEYKDVLDDLTKAQDAQRDAIDRVTEAREREAEAIDRVREAEEKLAEVRAETPDSIEAIGDSKYKPTIPSIPGTMENPIGNVFANDPFFDWSNIGSFVGTPGGNFGIQERIANITVQAQIGDPNAIADATVAALRQYERTNGYIPVTAQYIAGV